MSTTPRLIKVVIRDDEEVDRVTIKPTEIGCSVQIDWWNSDPDQLIQSLTNHDITTTPEEDDWGGRVEFTLDCSAIEGAARMLAICESVEGDDWELNSPTYSYQTVRGDIVDIGAGDIDANRVVIHVNRDPHNNSRNFWKAYSQRILNNHVLTSAGVEVFDTHDSGLAVTFPNTINLGEVMLALASCHQ
ncbi:MAG TPA: hypothetical protein VM581_00610 [Magnetospirillaceae bacterium]|nr:hypothetical protein [Magnetospirillaceae bacterium]